MMKRKQRKKQRQKQRKLKKYANNNNHNSLFIPQEIINNILIRLPVKSLLRFQCVCKHWKTLIKNPSFISHHLHFSILQNPSLIFDFDPRDGPSSIGRPFKEPLLLIHSLMLVSLVLAMACFVFKFFLMFRDDLIYCCGIQPLESTEMCM